MKSLIYCKQNSAKWLVEHLEGYSSYMLKIVNKPLLEYYIDFCVLQEISDIRIVFDEPDQIAQSYFEDGTQWGVNISFGIGNPCDGINEVLKKNHGFIEESGVLIFEQMFFLDYDKSKSEPLPDDKPWKIVNDNGEGLIYLPPSVDEESSLVVSTPEIDNLNIRVLNLSSFKEYFDLTWDVLKNGESKFVIPGYNNDPGIYIGQNVEIAKNCQITGPVSIGNGVTLKDLSVIGPECVIGSNVIIDRSNSVAKSIVLDNTYVGSDLELDSKIVWRNILVDPETETALKIEDEFIFTGMSSTIFGNLPTRIVHNLLSLATIVVMLPLWIIFKLLLLISSSDSSVDVDIVAKDREEGKLKVRQFNSGSILGRTFERLSLDKFSQLFHVLSGKLYLTGNSLLEDTGLNRNMVNKLPFYRPAVFSYIEYLACETDPDLEKEIHEYYYCHNRSAILDIKIFLKCILTRFFKPSSRG